MHKYLEERGVAVLVIGPTRAASAIRFQQKHDLPFPVLADPDRVAYHAYGLRKSLLVIQRSGTLLIDRAGTIRYALRVTDPKMALNERQLLDEVDRLTDA